MTDDQPDVMASYIERGWWIDADGVWHSPDDPGDTEPPD